jgi:hypothetical protein
MSSSWINADKLPGSVPFTKTRSSSVGRIIQISAYGWQGADAGASLCNASKRGIEGFTEAT